MDKINLFLDKLSKLKCQRIILFVSVIGTLIMLYLLNKNFPLINDDWMYAFIYDEQWLSSTFKVPPVRVSGLWDIVVSQYNHYMLWGGRNIVHGIMQFLLMIDDTTKSILNAVAYTSLIWFTYKISNKSNPANGFVFIFIAALTYICSPRFYEVFLWITASANYMWGPMLVIMFMYFFHSYYIAEKGKDNVFKIIGMFLFGIIAGWTNENMGVALIFYTTTILFLQKYEKRKIPKWMIFGTIGAIIGCVIMIAAPGNYVRYEISMNSSDLMNATFLEKYTPRLGFLWQHFTHDLLLLEIMYVAQIFLFIKFADNQNKKKILRASLLIFATAHIAFFAMLGSPEFPDRALAGIIALLIAANGILYANICTKRVLNIINIFVLVALLAVYSSKYIKRYKYQTTNTEVQDRDNLIKQQLDQGIEDVIIDRHYGSSLSGDSAFWINRAFSNYYGLKTVRVIPKEEQKKE